MQIQDCNGDKSRIIRQTWIDVLRGIGILTVILGHTTGFPYNRWIYGFHMPLFFLLSGLLLSEKKLNLTFKDYVKNCAVAYLIPYFLLCGINLILQSSILCFTHEWSVKRIVKYVIGILYSRGTKEWMPNCSPLWFLTAMFVLFLLWYWIQKLNHMVVILAVTGCAVISWLLDMGNVVKLPWNIDTALMAIVFLYIGQLCRAIAILWGGNGEDYKMRYIGLFLLFLLIGCLGIIYNPTQVNFDNNHYGNPILMIFGALGICLFLIQICFWGKWNGVVGKFIAYFGRHTIFIMGFDYFAGSISSTILGQWGLCHWSLRFMFKVLMILLGQQLWHLVIVRLPEKISIYLDY